MPLPGSCIPVTTGSSHKTPSLEYTQYIIRIIRIRIKWNMWTHLKICAAMPRDLPVGIIVYIRLKHFGRLSPGGAGCNVVSRPKWRWILATTNSNDNKRDSCSSVAKLTSLLAFSSASVFILVFLSSSSYTAALLLLLLLLLLPLLRLRLASLDQRQIWKPSPVLLTLLPTYLLTTYYFIFYYLFTYYLLLITLLPTYLRSSPVRLVPSLA